MMASVSEQLLATLEDLNTDELKRFKWHLKKHKGFPIAALEKADALDTVDLMMKRFGPEEAAKIMVDILRKMNQNDLAEQLEKKHKQALAERSIADPALLGASSKPLREPDPKTKRDFLQYSLQLNPDLNSVYKRLRLSENNRKITFTYTEQPYPDHPDRFDYFPQVLCSERVSGRSYWEIEGRGIGVCLSVSYKSISRKGRGDECDFGRNAQSWCLFCSSFKYIFVHNNIETELPVKPIECREAVYVDPSAGILSFYLVNGDTMSLIHTVRTTFTQPLYVGFSVGPDSSLKLCW